MNATAQRSGVFQRRERDRDLGGFIERRLFGVDEVERRRRVVERQVRIGHAALERWAWQQPGTMTHQEFRALLGLWSPPQLLGEALEVE